MTNEELESELKKLGNGYNKSDGIDVLKDYVRELHNRAEIALAVIKNLEDEVDCGAINSELANDFIFEMETARPDNIDDIEEEWDNLVYWGRKALDEDFTSYDDAVEQFTEYYIPQLRLTYEQDGVIDKPARREEWNNYTDYLCKDGMITMKQYETWDQPPVCEGR